MENTPCCSERVGPVLRREGHDPMFVMKLQNIHDATQPGGWEAAFQTLATVNNLVYTPPQEKPSDQPTSNLW